MSEPAETYTNPVYDGYCADPFILEWDGRYYAYATSGFVEAAGREALTLIDSPDLVNWSPLGSPLERLDATQELAYWAPEVVHVDGTFYLYYSIGVEDRGHQLRVATAGRPEGPFRDTGTALTSGELFAIDPNPFLDDDGQWYMYYAHDVLDGDRVGTAIAVDRMLDMTRLAGEPRTILRATADWQLFMRERPMYGGVFDWYTLEGPFVVKRGGRYYCTYSGGRWEEESYGVSYAVADSALGPWVEPNTAPALLQTVPGHVLGPGHCSIFVGPDGSDYVAYHAWDVDVTRRALFIDRLDWSDDGPTCSGPTYTPQPAPRRASPELRPKC